MSQNRGNWRGYRPNRGGRGGGPSGHSNDRRFNRNQNNWGNNRRRNNRGGNWASNSSNSRDYMNDMGFEDHRNEPIPQLMDIQPSTSNGRPNASQSDMYSDR